MTLRAVLAMLVAVCGVSTFGYWRYKVGAQTHPVAQFELIQDPSDSIQSDCGRMVGLTERVLLMKETGPGSSIAIFALGSAETANEPRLLGEFRVPVIRRVIEGQRAAAREKDSLLSKVRSKCEGVKEIRVSPIFQALKRGVEHLQTIGKPEDSRYLFIQTDGEETVDSQVKFALNERPGSGLKVSSRIQNDGVHVTLCGMAETIGKVTDAERNAHSKSKRRDARRAERLREVWMGVFTRPDLVRIEPYCSRETASH